MTETIAVAILTFASGLAGAVIGGVTAYKVAKFSAIKSHEQLLHSEKQQIYSELLDAYNSFLAYVTAAKISDADLFTEEERTLYTRFQSAFSKAILISSDDTRKRLTTFALLVNDFGRTRIEPKNLTISFDVAVRSMKEELSLK